MKKGDILENIVIDTMAAEGKCLARLDGQVLFIQGGAPGDTVDVELTKIKSAFLEGRVKSVRKFSEARAEPFCQHFGTCGGCSWQHINYETQLHYKQQQVVDNLERIGGLAIPQIRPIIGSAQWKYYRNKLDFTFSSHRWLTREELDKGGARAEPALGYHIPRMYDRVFDVGECHLQPDPSNAIRLAVRDFALKHSIPFFDLRKQVGFLRTLTIRNTLPVEAGGTGEVMVILQVTYDEMNWIVPILEHLEEKFPSISSFHYVINGKRNDTFADLNIVCWKGNPFITERMELPDGGSLDFRVGPKSFYQTNSAQARELYKIAFQFAALSGDEVVYDLYTGTGTIASYISRRASRVVGLEYVTAAVEDARINASINGITNASFFAGDIKDLLDDSFLAQNGRPDVVITDPPRAGMHEDVCRMLLKAAPSRIVYVSCNPATQARDLKLLAGQYDIRDVQPVDMFPHTTHVENVVLMEARVR
jgi:23S rRNA (uracil1939-C5)-methyltransferase